jgi:aminoglycoside phosphotransferase (APT) family kinase protein
VILPSAVANAVVHVLGAPVQLHPMAGGTNRRTFLAEAGDARWVVRSDPMPALSLQRAVAAQAVALGAGVRVPTTVAHGVAGEGEAAHMWCVETWHPGAPFDHEHTGTPEARAAIRDLGRQLRALHAVEVDAFGDLPPRPWDVYPTFEGWVANKRRRVEAAVRLAGGDSALASAIERAYARLGVLYAGGPRLSKGDCAGDNLLVAELGVTIIDWEWAQGLDPAADIAYWCRATPDLAAQELLLAAYAPPDLAAFRERIRLHQVVHAIETIHVLDEHRHAFDAAEREAGFRDELAALTQLVGGVGDS